MAAVAVAVFVDDVLGKSLHRRCEVNKEKSCVISRIFSGSSLNSKKKKNVNKQSNCFDQVCSAKVYLISKTQTVLHATKAKEVKSVVIIIIIKVVVLVIFNNYFNNLLHCFEEVCSTKVYFTF